MKKALKDEQGLTGETEHSKWSNEAEEGSEQGRHWVSAEPRLHRGGEAGPEAQSADEHIPTGVFGSHGRLQESRNRDELRKIVPETLLPSPLVRLWIYLTLTQGNS